jgi:hypothetical protein
VRNFLCKVVFESDEMKWELVTDSRMHALRER